MAATRRRKKGRAPVGEVAGCDLQVTKVEMLVGQLRMLGFPPPEREYHFHPERHWRFDLAWPDLRLAVEVEGGLWVGGRHNSPKGFIGDCEKYGEATVLGWQVLRVPTDWIGLRDWQAAELVARVVGVLSTTKGAAPAAEDAW